MSETTLAIRTDALGRSYTLGKVTTRVLTDVTLNIQEGEFVALVGPSGSGKSTLLNLIGGLDRPTTGVLEVFGQMLGTMNDAQLAKYRLRTVGMVFQSFNLLPHMTAEQNVLLATLFAGENMASAKARAAELFSRVGLTKQLHHRPTELSGGEQQRVAIVRALINKPRILLADEPTGNLDTKTGHDVEQLLTELATEHKMTLLVVTHDERIAARAHRTLHLLDGQIQKEPQT